MLRDSSLWPMTYGLYSWQSQVSRDPQLQITDQSMALSVSPNPNDRNPAYVPVINPDRSLRDGQFQYIVWDSYTAHRAGFFAVEAQRLADRYHGVAVYTATQSVRGRSGHPITQPIIVIYEVRTA